MMLHQLDHSNHMPTATTASTTTVATTGATTDNTINNTINPIDPNQPLSQISQLSHHHHHQQKGALAAAKADQARADTVSQPVLPLSLSLANHAAAAAASPLPLADADMPSQQSQQYQSENNNIPVLTVGPENSLQVISISNPLDPAVPIVYALESSASVHQHLQLQQQQQQQQLQKTHQLPPQALSTSSSSASLAASASVCTEPVQAYAKIEGRDFTYFVRKLTITLGRKIAQDDGVDVHLGSVKSISRQHAKIQFNFTHQMFEVLVLGKNGAIVDNKFVACNSPPVPLYNKSKLTMGDVECQFLLPKSDAGHEPDDTALHAAAAAAGGVGGGDPSSTTSLAAFPQSAYPAATVTSSGGSRRGAAGPAGGGGKAKRTKGAARGGSIYDDEGQGGEDGAAAAARSSINGEYSRPNLSYAAMISQAILSSADRKMTLAEIYQWIIETYPYYRNAPNGWQNSIRHNLSLNKAFKKVARDEPGGKGGWWTVDPDVGTFIPSTRRSRSEK